MTLSWESVAEQLGTFLVLGTAVGLLRQATACCDEAYACLEVTVATVEPDRVETACGQHLETAVVKALRPASGVPSVPAVTAIAVMTVGAGRVVVTGGWVVVTAAVG